MSEVEEKLGDANSAENQIAKTENAEANVSLNLFDLSTFANNEKIIDLTQARVNEIPEDLSRFKLLENLSLRQNLLTKINSNLESLINLTELDLYDNQLTEISGLDSLVNLVNLDLSYNRISKITSIICMLICFLFLDLTTLVNLKKLYLVNNKIEVIENLQNLKNLELLELGDNRIREIKNLENLMELKELYLGKNKITKIQNIGHLSKLRVLNIPGNRLTKIENLENLVDLEELHISDQGIENFDGIQTLVDNNQIPSWTEVEKLSKLNALQTVYLEHNPVHLKDTTNYRRKAILTLTQVTQIDAMACR